jgi:hypothetical protein
MFDEMAADWPRREATNIGIAEGAVKQIMISTSQIVSRHAVRLFIHFGASGGGASG